MEGGAGASACQPSWYFLGSHWPMLIGMVLGSFRSVMACVQSVAMRHLGMMRSLLVVPRLMLLGGGAMMLGRVFMVLRSLLVMIDVVFGHGILSSRRIVRPSELLITKT